MRRFLTWRCGTGLITLGFNAGTIETFTIVAATHYRLPADLDLAMLAVATSHTVFLIGQEIAIAGRRQISLPTRIPAAQITCTGIMQTVVAAMEVHQ